MIEAFLVAVGAAVVFFTIVEAGQKYSSLPVSVPLHFGIDGTVNMYGPRPMVWMLVAVELFCATLFLYVMSQLVRQQLPVRETTAMIAFGDIVLLQLWRAQKLIIETALSGKTRADLRGFWMFFAATMTSAILLVVVFR